jgi:hypothetical protein
VPLFEHDEEMYIKYGDGISKDQHLVIYSMAYQHGHSAGDSEVEQYYKEFADFARDLLDADV